MAGGNWIKLNRSILEWEWYDDINTKVLFIHLLLTVNYEPKKWHGITIDRGQRVVSLAELAEETGLSIQNIRTAINHLKSTGELTRTLTRTLTGQVPLVTIENYNKYQDVTFTSDKASDTQTDTHSDKRPTSDRQQLKKEKKEKNKEREGETAHSKHPYGRKGNVWLTEKEYEGIKERFKDYERLIDHVGDYLSNSKPYDDHEALIMKIGREDKWALNVQRKSQELSQEEIDRMRTETFGANWKN